MVEDIGQVIISTGSRNGVGVGYYDPSVNRGYALPLPGSDAIVGTIVDAEEDLVRRERIVYFDPRDDLLAA